LLIQRSKTEENGGEEYRDFVAAHSSDPGGDDPDTEGRKGMNEEYEQ
jgi:hypothetical protein